MACEKAKPNERNYYRILCVQPDAPMEIVQASYRTIRQSARRIPTWAAITGMRR